MSERDLLRDGTAERKSDDVRCRDTELVQNAHRDVRQHRHRVGNDRSLARAHSRDVKGDHGSAAKRVAERRPTLHRAAQPVEQQDRITGTGDPGRDSYAVDRQHRGGRLGGQLRQGHGVART